MIIEQRERVKEMFQRVKELREQGQEGTPHFHQMMEELQSHWASLKEHESQRERKELLSEKVLNIGQNGSGCRPIWSESQIY